MTTLLGRRLAEMEVNGETRQALIAPGDVLLDTLRDELGLTGAKPGCRNGDCGACTVVVDGRPIKSCLMYSAEAIGHRIETVEGLRQDAVQEAFVQRWAFQCGYCTAGFLMLTHALATARPGAGPEERLHWLRSNICRCTGYAEIVDAVGAVVQDHGEGAQASAP